MRRRLPSLAAPLFAAGCMALALPVYADDPDWAFDDGAAPAAEPAPEKRPSRRPLRATTSSQDAYVEEPTELEQAPAEEVELARPARRRPRDRARPATQPASPATAPEDAFGSRRIQVFLVPIGSTATLAAGSVQTALEAEVRRLPGFRPVDLVEALAVPPAPQDAKSMERARQAIADGNAVLLGHDYAEAANRYKHAIRLMEEANDALDAWSYADAFARLAVAFTLSGEEAKGNECFLMAARADLAGQVVGSQIDRKVGSRLDGARGEVANGPTGALSVLTSIPGARVFLGGVYKGTTPLTIDSAPAGLNYVRLDRPGAFPVVRIVDVKEAFDTPLKVKLNFTPEALELQRTLQQVPRSLGSGLTVPDMVTGLGTRFRLERAVVSTVEMAETNVASVRVAVFDLPRQARLVDETAKFALDIEGGLEEAVRKWVRMVFDKGDGARDRSANDPLDRSDGTESWYTATESRSKTLKARAQEDEDDENLPEWERSNYQPRSYRARGSESADPLDHGDGTEDW